MLCVHFSREEAVNFAKVKKRGFPTKKAEDQPLLWIKEKLFYEPADKSICPDAQDQNNSELCYIEIPDARIAKNNCQKEDRILPEIDLKAVSAEIVRDRIVKDTSKSLLIDKTDQDEHQEGIQQHAELIHP